MKGDFQEKNYIFFICFLFFLFSCDSRMTKVEYVGKVKKLKTPIIAKVNNIPITVDDYKREKAKLPKDLQKLLKKPEKKYQFIQNLIDKVLIYEESKKAKIDEDPEFKRKLEILKKELMIQEFLKRKISENIHISEKEIEDYYKKNRANLNAPLSKVRAKIIEILKKRKEQVLFQKYIDSLRNSAKIELNTKEIQNLN